MITFYPFGRKSKSLAQFIDSFIKNVNNRGEYFGIPLSSSLLCCSSMQLVDTSTPYLDTHSFSDLTKEAFTPTASRELYSSSPAVSIVGGGFCGTAALLQLLRAYPGVREVIPDEGMNRLVVNWIDSSKQWARGVPYCSQGDEEANSVFLLNFPSYYMSPFPGEPLAYHDWVLANKLEREESQLVFTPRAWYGDFLEMSVLEEIKHFKDLGFELDLRFITGQVSRVDPGLGSTVVTFDTTQKIESGSVVVAAGHREVDGFRALSQYPGYVQNPHQLDSYRRALEEQPHARRIVLVGGGPTTFDALRAFEYLGYTGHYYLVSSAPGRPWVLEPRSAEDVHSRPWYRFKYLTVHQLSPTDSYRDFKTALKEEIRNASRQGYGPETIYYDFDFEGVLAEWYQAGVLTKEWKEDDRFEGLRSFMRYLAYHQSNPAAPVNIALRKQLLQDHRLHVISGRASSEDADYSQERRSYAVNVSYRNGRQLKVEGDIFLSGTRYPKTAPNDLMPLHQYQGKQGIYALGPYAPIEQFYQVPWGVGVFKHHPLRFINEVALHAMTFSMTAALRAELFDHSKFD